MRPAALALDVQDPLASFAAGISRPLRLQRPQGSVTYPGIRWACNPSPAAQYIEQELADWRRLGVLGHHEAQRPWIGYHEALTAPLASRCPAARARRSRRDELVDREPPSP